MEGRKRWRLYDALVEQPRPDLKFKARAAEVGEPFVDFVLEAGDLLYLPSGLIHEAHTLDDDQDGAAAPSLHLTLGIESTVFGSWESLLLELVVDAAEAEEQEGEEKEGLGLRCSADGPMLRDTLSAPIDAAAPASLRWGDLLSLLIVHVAEQERGLRQAVPLTPLLVQGAGGQAAVLQQLARAAAVLKEKEGPKVEIDGERPLLPRSLGPPGSAGRRVQQRIEAAAPAVAALLDKPEVMAGLGRAVRQLECALSSHAPAAMQRFSAVATRDREGRQEQRREKLEKLARTVSVATVEAGRVMGDKATAQMFAVGGGDGEL